MDYRIIHAGAEHLTLLARLFDEYRQFYGKPADLRAAAEFLRERILQCQSMLLLASRRPSGLNANSDTVLE